MMTLLGSLLGLLGSTIPDLFRVFQDKRDKKHEVELLKVQMEMASNAHTYKMQALESEADIKESEGLYTTYTVGVDWVDALNGTVRPVLAYAMFTLYAAVKVAFLSSFMDGGASLAEAVINIWGEEDQAFFACILSFYFGKRGLEKAFNYSSRR